MTSDNHHHINYVEIPTRDIAAAKQFYHQVFAWQFTDYGPDYVSIENAGVDGGFYMSDKAALTANGSVLVVLYSRALEQTQGLVEQHGGTISQPIFDFPGGRRFHFIDPCGNEMAVWSDN